MRPWQAEQAGRFERLTLVSQVLAGNPLGDPAERPVWVYLPPGYDDEPDGPLPMFARGLRPSGRG